MANVLAAIGEAAPALTQTWRNLQASEREERQTKMAETMMPFQIEQARSNVAITQANVSKIQQENTEKARIQKKLNEPDTVDRWVQKMPLSPEGKNAFRMLMPGLDPSGVGTRGEIAKATTEALANPLFKNIITSEHEFTQQRYQTAKENYETLNVKPGAQEKAAEAYKIMMAEKKNLDVTGRLVGASINIDRNRQLIQNWVKANPEQYNAMSSDKKRVISQGGAFGVDPKELMVELNKLDVKESGIAGKGADFKMIKDDTSPTGYSYQSVVNPDKPPIKGAPGPAEKTPTEISLIQKAQQGDKEAQKTLDIMQKRKVEAAEATLDIKSKDIDIQSLASAVSEGQDARMAIKGSMGNPVASKVQSEVLKKYPKFNFEMSDANYKWRQSATNQRTINFAGGAQSRVGALAMQLNSIPNTDIPIINKVMRQVSIQTGRPEYTDFESNRNAIVQEINTALSGSATGSDMRIRIELENLMTSRSPRQILGAINNLNEALIARLDVDMSPLYPIEVVQGKISMEDYKKETFKKYREPFVKGMGKEREKEVSFSPKKFDELVKYAEESLGKAKTNVQKNEILKRFREMTGKELPW